MDLAAVVNGATFVAAAVLVARNLVHVRVGAAAAAALLLPPCAAVSAVVFVVVVATLAAVTNVDCLQLAQRCI